jgi:hypothetical protein
LRVVPDEANLIRVDFGVISPLAAERRYLAAAHDLRISFGAGGITSRTFEASRGYPPKTLYPIQSDEATIVKRIIAHQLAGEEKKAAGGSKTIAALRKYLSEKEDRTDDETALLTRLTKQFASGSPQAVSDFVHTGLPDDPAPFNSGYVVRTRIANRRHKADTSFDDRSKGFVWFFSFLVWFSEVRKQYGENVIILLDEPGLSLHARAQADLLRYFNEQLRPKHQVIYTTHSPLTRFAASAMSSRISSKA